MMKACGINKIYYSTDDEIVCEKITNMVSINCSSVMKSLEREYYSAPKKDIDFFQNLLQKKMPSQINMYNLECFLNYNFKEVLPKYKYKICKNKVYFYNSNNVLILITNINI
uniref:Uncharacterized protein n=1 Tax=Megaviridae environmental sample TaxID=1737588 RepID=A0A5J6VM94_9VIRU|nr:MAG: hypothetical protein [Megaviridae environmental sample]